MRRSIRLLAVTGLLCIGSMITAFGQGLPDSIFTCGKVAVTCESLNDADPVLAIMDISGINAAPTGDNWISPGASGDHGIPAMAYIRRNLGQVFGLAYDNRGLYTTAAGIYSPAFQAWGTINNVNNPGGAANENRGSIYFIANHVIREIADLPNTGQGLGNITYDNQHDRLYVTNFYDGKIYIVNPTTGATTGTFDPAFDGNSYGTTGTFIQLGQRPWGIAVWGSTVNNTILYYSRWVYDLGSNASVLAQNAGARNEIWSVTLDASGNPIPTTETLVAKIPILSGYTFSNPVADLEISTDGSRMLASERTMYGTQTSAHSSRLLELRRSSSSSTVWNFEPLTKFGMGNPSNNQVNATGGCDYGDVNLVGERGCTGTVYGMSDYIPSAWGFVYGFQIMNPNGGTKFTSKLVDLNNIPGTNDKTHLGDVDYKRCFPCPPVLDSCDFFHSDTLGGTCCKGGLVSNSPAGVSGIATVSYTVTNGTVLGFTSNCPFTSAPANVSGTTTGTLTFTAQCSLQELYGSLQTTSAAGDVTITWTVTYFTGKTCVYVSRVTACPPPPRICSDKIDVKQCNCGPTSSQSYLDIFITNTAAPASTMCGVLVTKLDAFGVPQTGYWTGAAQSVAPTYNWTSVTATTTPVAFTPLTIPLNGVLHAQMYFFGASFTGSISIQVVHCSGSGNAIVYDTCTYIWKPSNGWTPATDKKTVPGLTSVKSEYNDLSALTLKLVGPEIVIGPICNIKYWAISTIEDASIDPRIVAITGAEQYQEDRVQGKTVAAPLDKSSMARHTALFELQRPLSLAGKDSTEAFTVVFGNDRPKRLRYSFYDETGALISTDTVTIRPDSVTGIVHEIGPVTGQHQNDDFMLMNGYPNPAGESYNVRYITGSPQRILMTISQSSGDIIKQLTEGLVEAGIHEKWIDVSDLPNGVYLLRIESETGLTSESVKVVIQR